MKDNNAIKAATIIEMTGYHHDSQARQQVFMQGVLDGNTDLIDFITPETLGFYTLAEQPTRSLKNSVIILTAIISREVLKFGVTSELCFSLSDYYINQVEKLNDTEAIVLLTKEMLLHYSNLVTKQRNRRYSLPIMRSIRYIHQHLYESIQVKDVAKAITLNPTYLSALFKKEVRCNMTEYVRDKRLEYVKNLIINSELSIPKIAEMLGYKSTSHFSRDFKKQFSCSPYNFKNEKTSQTKA